MLHLLIRFAGLGARFLLAMYIVRFLDLSGMGLFGIISSIVSMSPAILGLGVNYFLNRDLVEMTPSEAGSRIRDRLIMSSSMSLLAIVAVQAWFAVFRLPLPEQILLIYAICCLETIATDLHNCLVSRNLLLVANWLFFIRSASWVFLYIALGLVWPEFRSFEILLGLWLSALIANFALTAYYLRDWPWQTIAQTPTDFAKLLEQIRHGGLIYLSDLANIALQVCDRFVIIAMLGLEATGVFVFFWSFANAVHNLTWVIAVQPSLPKLVSALSQGGLARWREQFRVEILKASGYGLVISAIVFIGVVVMLPYLRADQLSSQLPLLLELSIYTVIRIAGDVVGYGLYSLNRDRDYASSVVYGALLNPMVTVVGISMLGIQGAGVAMILVASAVFIMRLRSILRVVNAGSSYKLAFHSGFDGVSVGKGS